ncbi:MAG: hypothetical protein MKZ95_16180 [Pirellulales bacterium]|nr:hypothetical protein [Pirellulales bacterium]|tara:strand:- start:493 stop:639 length:147 start_codon:yes stop_codon:yes gene_type:complete
MTLTIPIRQQRKAETRNKLIIAAQELFELQRHECATLEGVVERASLHV